MTLSFESALPPDKTELKTPLRVNLYGGPGAGKSTIAHKLIVIFKENGINAELVPEHIKPQAYKNIPVKTLSEQLALQMKQHESEQVWFDAGIDVLVCESPILLNVFYGHLLFKQISKEFCKDRQSKTLATSGILEDLVAYRTAFTMYDIHEEMYPCLDYYLARDDAMYSTEGRFQTLEQAKEIDTKLKQFMMDCMEPWATVIEVAKYDQIISDVLSKVPTLATKFKNSKQYLENNNVTRDTLGTYGRTKPDTAGTAVAT